LPPPFLYIIRSLLAKIGTLPGDILLISSFLSYVGCFTRRYREELQHKMWLPNFRKIDVSSHFHLPQLMELKLRFISGH